MKQRVWWGLFVVGVSLGLLSPLLPFGLDFTDAGYSTTLAWLQVTHPQAADWTINSFGTPLLAGLWFKLTGWDSILGFRIFWMFWITLGMVAAYYALTTEYNPRSVALALIPTLFLAMFNSEEVLIPEYHNFPTVFCLGCITFLLLALRSESRFRLIWAIKSGALAGLMVFARLPLATFIIVIYLVLLFCIWQQNDNRRSLLNVTLFFTLGLALGITLSLFILSYFGYSFVWIGELSAHSQTANTRLTQTYGAALGYYPLWLSTAIRYGKILGMGCIALAGAALWRFVWSKIPTKPSIERFSQVIVIIVVATLIIIVVRSGDTRFLGFHYGPITSLLLGAPLLLLCLRVIFDFRSFTTEKLVLFGFALALFGIASLGGSGVWVSTFRHGVWLMLPVALLESGGTVERWLDSIWLRRILIVGAIILGCSLRYYMPYRDKPLHELTATFTRPPLTGIRSSEGRVRALDELLGELQRRSIKANDTLQAYPDGALLYFLTKTIPWWRDPWIGMQWTNKEDLVHFSEHLPGQPLAGRRITPQYVIRVKFDPNAVHSLDPSTPTRMFDFGAGGIIDSTGARLYYGFLEQPASRFLDSLFYRRGYSVVWENKGFAVLQRP